MPDHRDSPSDEVIGRRARVPTGRLLPAAVGLAVLAVSHPLLDLAARQPQFLVAHDLDPLEVGLVALAVLVAPATVAGLGALAARRVPGGAVAVLALPLALIVLYIGARMELGGVPLLVTGAVTAVGASLLYVRHPSVRDMARYLAAVPILVLAYFYLVVPPEVLAGGHEGAAERAASDPFPIVLLVFDELPVASLIGPGGELLEERFPSFGRLAADGVWYRNAITVETRTTESIPAILTGMAIADDTVPNVANHPDNLFTMLAGSHDVEGIEPVTGLCPDDLCGDQDRQGKWGTLATDLAVVYGHLVVPAPWTARLPPIDQNWTDFASESPEESWDLMEAVGEAVEGDRRTDVRRFLDSLPGDSAVPPLRIAHFALPHRPWEFFPDGTRHGQDNVEGYGERGWGGDEFFVAEGWRRHLLQVGYTDTVVGLVLQRLEEADLYRSSLVAVVADHGVHFAADVEDMRVTDRSSLGSILPVPLFVKYPQGLDRAPPPGSIDDRRVETVDVVPTILDAVGAEVGPDLDGRSLLTDFRRRGSELELRGEPFPVDGDGTEKLAVARRKDRWFPGGDVWSLVPDPSQRPQLGRPISPDGWEWLATVPPTDVPHLVEGQVDSPRPLQGDESVALTADGTLIAITRVHDVEGTTGRYSFLLNPEVEQESPLEVWLGGE